MPIFWNPTPAEIIAELPHADEPDSWLNGVTTPAQITQAIIGGRDAIRFSAIENIDSKRRATIRVRLSMLGLTSFDVSEVWFRRLFFIPADFRGYDSDDGSRNWINLGNGLTYMRGGQPWTSGKVQMSHKQGENFLRFQGFYRFSSDGESIATGYHAKTLPFGEWHEWIACYRYSQQDQPDGRVRHWINKDLVYDFQNICVTPNNFTSERCNPRFYLGIPINMPQHIYQTDLALSDEPFDVTPPTPSIALIQIPFIAGLAGIMGGVM